MSQTVQILNPSPLVWARSPFFEYHLSLNDIAANGALPKLLGKGVLYRYPRLTPLHGADFEMVYVSGNSLILT